MMPAAASMPPLLCVDRSWAAALPRPARAGAFDWWYVDGRDEGGDGLVFIWGRLPFFEGDAPSVNLSIYRGGRRIFWLLQRYSSGGVGAAGAAGFEAELGRSRLALRRSGADLRLEAALDLALPGDPRRLTGSLRLQGPSALLDGPSREHRHRWVPLVPFGALEVDLRCGAKPLFRFEGDGYADRNLGDAPLASLGVRRWRWGRALGGGRCTGFYALEGEDGRCEGWLLEATPAGVEVRPRPLSGAEGEALQLPGLRALSGRTVERGPFYSRSFGSLERAAEGGLRERAVPAILERCEVARIGHRWHRPLVRMRMHHLGGSNSIWAPLFNGPRGGRLRSVLRFGLARGREEQR